MSKFITILLVFSMTLAISQSQSCSTTFAQNFDITVQSSQQASGINFCKAIKDSNTCCSADVVNGFENKAKELIARLTASVSTRDRMIIQARKTAFAVRGALSRIQAASAKATENLQNYSPSSGSNSNSGGEVTIDISDFADMANGFGAVATFLTGNLTELVGGFDTFQEKRKECVEQLVNLQTASWCLACDPNQAIKGVNGGTLTIHADLDQKLVDACAPFIVQSAAQNAYIGIHFMSGMLNGMANGMEKLAANNIEGGINDFFMAMLSMLQGGAVSQPSSIDQAPSTLPANCDETTCEWITKKLFVNGKINEQYLAAGGDVEDPAQSSGSNSEGFSFNRLLGGNRYDDDEEAPVKIIERKLQGGWNPDADESGIQVTFEANPAGIVNDEKSLSGLRNAIVGFSLVVLAVLFF